MFKVLSASCACLCAVAAGGAGVAVWSNLGSDCRNPEATDCASEVGCALAGGELERPLNDVEQKVVSFVADLVAEGESPMVDGDVLKDELDLTDEDLASLDQGLLQTAVLLELKGRGVDVSALAAGNCAKYNACSVDRDLNDASGAELVRYQAEVALDGVALDDWKAPGFEFPITSGGRVALADHQGRNLAVVFLSMHCNHSLGTIPILEKLSQHYGEDVTILPVFVNSGNQFYVQARLGKLGYHLPVLVSEDKTVSAAYDSRMVPSTFLIDAQGFATKKLVGFKKESELRAAIDELIGA